jgi:hypothetical protein
MTEDLVTTPTPESLATSPTTLSAAEFSMRPAALRKAADGCREVAQDFDKQADEIAVANLEAAAGCPATRLAAAATGACVDMSTAMRNMAGFYRAHADALVRAAVEKEAQEAQTAAEVQFAYSTGTTGR